MSNCTCRWFRVIRSRICCGLLAISAVTILSFRAEMVCGQEPSPTRSTRKVGVPRNTINQSREVRSAVAIDNEGESEVVQVACKNCQPNTGGSIAPEHNHQASDNSEEYVTDESGSMGSMGSSCDACDSNACMPWGISLNGSCGSGCDGNCIDPCSPLGLLSRRLYMRAEATSFWGTGQLLPTLVTTSVGNPLAAPADAGILGAANTRSLFGGREVGTSATTGIRYEVGVWLDDCRSRGVLVRMFDTGENDVSLQTDGTRQAVIARNFLDVGPPREQSVVSVAYPNQTSGSISANLSSNTNGGDLLYRQVFYQDHLGRWDWLAGYQTGRLTESLDIVSNTTSLNAPNPILDQQDHFRTRNQFHGATLGLGGEAREGNWFFGGLFKVGLGNMERRVDISGSSRTTVGTDVSTQNQGLLARQTNIGTYRTDTFVLVPELGLHVGYRLTGNLDFTVGYSLLRLPKVVRVTETLDRELASNLSSPLTGELRPSFALTDTHFTLHSLNLGLQWAY